MQKCKQFPPDSLHPLIDTPDILLYTYVYRILHSLASYFTPLNLKLPQQKINTNKRNFNKFCLHNKANIN